MMHRTINTKDKQNVSFAMGKTLGKKVGMKNEIIFVFPPIIKAYFNYKFI